MKKLLTILFVFICLKAAGFTQRILVMNTSFNPPFFTVTVGDTVVWINYQGVHSISSVDIPAGAEKFSKLLDANGSILLYIPQVAGDYSYQCDIFSSEGMMATFHVVSEKAKTFSGEALKLQASYVTNYVSFDKPANIKITPIVKDITGKIIRQFPMMNSSEELFIGDLSNGVYILEIKAGDEIQNLRFVKLSEVASAL